MKKIILIVFLILIGFLVLQQWVLNTYHGSTFSKSINDSKEKGYFVCEYHSIKDSINLKKGKIKTPDIWMEVGNETTSEYFFFSRTRENTGSRNMVINDIGICEKENVHYFLKIDYYHSLNCLEGIGHVYLLNLQPTSFLLYIKQPDDSLGWKKATIVDSIEYKIGRIDNNKYR